MPATVSPLAPESHAGNAGDRRRPPCHRGSRHPLCRPHRRDAGAVRAGHDGGRRVHPLANARPRRSTGAARSIKGGTARALVVNSGNANAFTGRNGRAATEFTAELAAQACRLQARRGLPRLDRRHRRAARRQQVRRRAGRPGRQAREPAAGRCGARDHDHRHLPEARHRTCPDRQGRGHDQRHRQRRRHDRARHGDHAGVRVHRRADRGAGAAGAAAGRARSTRSTP